MSEEKKEGRETVPETKTEEDFFEAGDALGNEEPKPESKNDKNNNGGNPGKEENMKPETPAPPKPEPKPSNGGNAPVKKKAKSATPTSAWLLGALLLALIIGLLFALLRDTGAEKANSAKVTADRALSTTSDKVSKKDLQKALADKVGKKDLQKALDKKVDKKTFDKYKKARNADLIYMGENRERICQLHGHRKDFRAFCKGLNTKAKRTANRHRRPPRRRRMRSPRWHVPTTPAVVTPTNSNLERRVAALERSDKEQNKLIKSLREARDKWGPKYDAHMRKVLGLADPVQARSK